MQKMIKRGWSYSLISPDETVGSDCFLPIFDGTRNLSFIHRDCLNVARVVGIRLTDSMDGDLAYIYLRCEKCKKTGSRRIFLSWPGTYRGQLTYFNGRVYIYGAELEPEQVIEVLKG
jgi:hypothetical protein